MTIKLYSKKIIKEWTDYNGHMNVAYYVLIFDTYAAEKLMTDLKMGEHSAKTTGKSTMVVESNITYNQEVKEGDEVDINLVYFDHDKKRLLYKLEMIHKEKKYIASTIETLALYVDLNKRKVAEFEDDKNKLMDSFIDENKKYFIETEIKFLSKLKK
ncbi:thioesterase family protein [Candidatus Pelagibacter sp.]|nr:thioesterase family protein [Candidatus Pelagibacter sp.]|tara:strand:- start:1148 stop:1618 length:471 start_codon:yes stop_codon:yes gene_type:complete